ncbi:MAG: hypothetical protein V9G16_07755 [Nitrosomonas sp.]
MQSPETHQCWLVTHNAGVNRQCCEAVLFELNDQLAIDRDYLGPSASSMI